ncbi:hypothetical protein [Bradyrhizobium genosp. A]
MRRAKKLLFVAAVAGGLKPPAGYVFLVDSDGAYLTDSDGFYLIDLA